MEVISSIRNPRTRHSVVIVTHITWLKNCNVKNHNFTVVFIGVVVFEDRVLGRLFERRREEVA
jgi:hypothetical protein